MIYTVQMCEIDTEATTQWTLRSEPHRLKGHLAHPRHCGVTSLRGMPWGSLRLKTLGLSPAQPCNHRDTPERAKQCAPCGITDLPTLWSHSRKPTHERAQTTAISIALLILPVGIWLECARMCQRVRVCVFVSVGQCAAGKEGG